MQVRKSSDALQTQGQLVRHERKFHSQSRSLLQDTALFIQVVGRQIEIWLQLRLRTKIWSTLLHLGGTHRPMTPPPLPFCTAFKKRVSLDFFPGFPTPLPRFLATPLVTCMLL